MSQPFLPNWFDRYHPFILWYGLLKILDVVGPMRWQSLAVHMRALEQHSRQCGRPSALFVVRLIESQLSAFLLVKHFDRVIFTWLCFVAAADCPGAGPAWQALFARRQLPNYHANTRPEIWTAQTREVRKDANGTEDDNIGNREKRLPCGWGSNGSVWLEARSPGFLYDEAANHRYRLGAGCWPLVVVGSR